MKKEQKPRCVRVEALEEGDKKVFAFKKFFASALTQIKGFLIVFH